MAITNTNIKEQYAPTSPTNSYSFDVRYFDETDVNVEVVDSEGTLTVLTLGAETDGFEVTSVNGNPANGAIVNTSETYTSGDTITIFRIIPITQESEFLRGGDLPPEVLNDVLDRGIAVSQEINEDNARSLICPITDPVTGVNYELPDVDLRKNKVVGFDGTGSVIPVDIGEGGGLIGVDTYKGLNTNNGIVECKVDGDTLEFDGSGNLSVKTVGNAEVRTNAISTTRIQDGAVTYEKLEPLDDFRVLGRVNSGEYGYVEEVHVSQDLDTAFDNSICTANSVKDYVDNALAILGNVVSNYIDSPVVYTGIGGFNLISIGVTTTFFPRVLNTSRVKVEIGLSVEAPTDTVFVLRRRVDGGDWTDITAPTSGNRNNGLFAPSHDNDNLSTPSTVTYTYIDDTSNEVGTLEYSVWYKAAGDKITVNRSFSDSDNSTFERLTSYVILTEIPS